MNKVAFFMTFDQLDALKTLATCRAAWPTFRKSIRLALLRMALVTREEKPSLTHAGIHAAGLALFLVKASPVGAVELIKPSRRQAVEQEAPAAAGT